MIHEERCLYFDKDFSNDCEYKSSLMTIKEFNTFNKSLFSAIYNKLKKYNNSIDMECVILVKYKN